MFVFWELECMSRTLLWVHFLTIPLILCDRVCWGITHAWNVWIFISNLFCSLFCNLLYKSHMLIVYYLDINNFVVWLMCMQFFLSRRRCKKEFLLAQITQLLWAITSVWKQYTVTDFRTATSSKIRSQSRIVCNFRIRRHSLQKRQIFTHREKIRDSVKTFFCVSSTKYVYLPKPVNYEITLNILLGNERAQQKLRILDG